MYVVINPFYDSRNNNYLYEAGDTYPAPGYKPTKARIEALSSTANPVGRVFIREEKDENT